jgi:hypothetical protein
MLLADVLDMMKVVCEKYLVSLNDWIDDLLVIEMVERRVTEERKKYIKINDSRCFNGQQSSYRIIFNEYSSFLDSMLNNGQSVQTLLCCLPMIALCCLWLPSVALCYLLLHWQRPHSLYIS